MAAPVALHPLPGGRFEVRCGGCMLHSVLVEAPNDDEAWREMARQGWTAFRWDEHSHAYAKCPKCSTEPRHPAPRRKARRHR